MAPAWQQEELATKTTMMHNRTAEQSVEEGLANPLRFFANLLTVYVRLDEINIITSFGEIAKTGKSAK